MSETPYGLYAVGILAIVLLFFGARAVDEHGEVRLGQGDPVKRPTAVKSAYGADLVIARSRGGHYLTEARMDGAPVDVLVDTGASFTTLRESDAQDAGINPRRNEYTYSFSTANGEVMAARATLDELELGPAILSDVTVFVLPDDKLEISLLGMNVLREFDRMEMTQDGLRLSLE